MRTVERAARRGVARAVVLQHRAVAVLDLDRGMVEQQLLHPAVERDLGRRERRRPAARPARPAGAAPSPRAPPRPRPQARRSRARSASSQCGSGRGSSSSRLRERRRAPAPLTRPVCSASTASTSRSRKRRRSDAGPHEQLVHRRREPDHAQMVGEGRRRARPARGRSGTCAAARASSPAGGSMPVPSVASPSMPSTSADDRPGAVALGERHLIERRAAQARGPGTRNEIASIRLVLPAPFGPASTTRSPADLEACRVIAAEIRQRQTADRGGGHDAIVRQRPAYTA